MVSDNQPLAASTRSRLATGLRLALSGGQLNPMFRNVTGIGGDHTNNSARGSWGGGTEDAGGIFPARIAAFCLIFLLGSVYVGRAE